MGKKKHLSHDQKRKLKKAKQAARSREEPSLAYTGNKYKTDALIPVVMRAETGIYETYVMTDRRITDHTVKAALTKMVLQMRQAPLPPLPVTGRIEVVEGREEDFIILNIRRNWEDLFATMPRPGSETLTGVLRTLIGSVEVWSTRGASSRGYLNFIEGFLRKGGVTVQKVSPDMEPIPGPEEDPLLEVGRDWCDGEPGARAQFLAQAEELIRAGETDRVVNVCQRLIGEIGMADPMRELSALSIRAQQSSRTRLA
jgi:hypothetical protein